MAIVKCKSCGYKAYGGCMPTASCGLLLLGGLSIGLALGGTSAWLALTGWPMGLRVILSVLAAIIGAIAGGWLIQVVPWSLEYVLAHRHRCSQCGARRWSFPFTEGFGL